MAENNPEALKKQIAALEEEILAKKGELAGLRKSTAPQEVCDYTFATLEGEKKLSDLFDDRDELVIIHNMGKGCAYCTLWADGFNGVLHHLVNRAAFAVVSPNDPTTQREFAESRGWRFRMASSMGSTFTKDMGFLSAKGSQMPGVSTFIRRNDKIYRVAHAFFGPGDDYCGVWHLFDLLPEAANDWAPKFNY